MFLRSVPVVDEHINNMAVVSLLHYVFGAIFGYDFQFVCNSWNRFTRQEKFGSISMVFATFLFFYIILIYSVYCEK